MWEVEYTDEFEEWWNLLSEAEQEAVTAYVGLLERRGSQLEFPYCSSIESSRHSHMRELRVQCKGHPIRVLYAFDPRRTAILLLGGDKAGNDSWYSVYVPRADRLYDQHIQQLRDEGLIDG